MVAVNVRYVVERKNDNGSTRRYWMRPGYDSVRLPDKAWAEFAERLNNEVDAGKRPRRKVRLKIEPDFGTVGYWCNLYEASTEASVGVARPFNSLAPNTRKNYLRALRDIKERLAKVPLRGMTRRALVEYLETVPTAPLRRVSRNVWLNLFSLALARGDAAQNPVTGLTIATSPRRDQLWMPDDIDAWMGFCEADRGGARWRLMFMLLLYTGQRIGDVLAMTWADYDGSYIKVKQEKTGAKVEVYCHHILKEELERWRASRRVIGPTILTRYDGRPLSYNRVRNRTTEILTEIGRRHLQLRDLRRTAATKLAEAGCTTPQIAAITGHSIERCQRILDTYVVKTKATSKAAIERLERFERTKTRPKS